MEVELAWSSEKAGVAGPQPGRESCPKEEQPEAVAASRASGPGNANLGSRPDDAPVEAEAGMEAKDDAL